MPTETNARLNLQTAVRNVRTRMGLSDTPADWTYEQRIAYNKALAAEIQSYPASFTPEILVAADQVVKTNYQALDNPSFAWGDFAAETVGNAPSVLGGFTNKLLVGAAVVAAVYFGVMAFQKYRGAKP